MEPLLNLGLVPLVNNLCLSPEEAIRAERFPLNLLIDEDLTIQLDTIVDREKMFSNYLYRSSISQPFIQHCSRLWDEVEHLVPVGGTVVDIGGNDGALLDANRFAKKKSIEKYNVDPCGDFRGDNEQKGINFQQGFWADSGINIPKADCITSTNVFQHHSNADAFVSEISKNLDGIWVLEFPYFLTSAKTLQFDQAYHEHYYYWLVKPLSILFEKFGLSIISISEHSIHGGTIRIISTNKPEIRESYCKPGKIHCNTVQDYIYKEEDFDFSNLDSKVNEKIDVDREILEKICSSSTIAAFGAAAKGCTYLNCLKSEILIDSVKFVVDDTPHKQGKFIPGTDLEVVPREILFEKQPDYLLILAHNFSEHIANSLRGSYTGKIITMFPDFRVLV